MTLIDRTILHTDMEIRICNTEGIYLDKYGREREGRCTQEAVMHCCGQWFCPLHHDDHRDDCPVPDCVWCDNEGQFTEGGRTYVCDACNGSPRVSADQEGAFVMEDTPRQAEASNE